MLSSWPIARSSLAGRRGRTALLVAAVALAASLVTAVSCAVWSLQQTVADRIHVALGATNARVVHEFNTRFAATTVDEIETWPGVEVAEGRLFASITLVRAPSSGSSDSDERPPRTNVDVRGAELGGFERFGQIELRDGRLPTAADEILLDPLAAKTLEVGLGDRLLLQRFGPSMEFEVVGIYGRPMLGMLQRPGAQMPLASLAEATGREDEISVVSIILEEGLDAEEWVTENEHRLDSPLLLEPAELAATGFDRQVKASRLGFLLGAAIAFLSCSFIVATGMTTAVVEQQRVLAVARCIGAERGQLFVAQLIAGVVICGLGAVIGIPLGLLIAWVLVRQFPEQIPDGLSISGLGIGLAFGGSVLAGLVGAAFPAWRACRVSPLAALAARSVPPSRSGLVLITVIGAGCVLLQIALLALPDPAARFWTYFGFGLLLIHVGWFLLAVPIMWALRPALSAILTTLLRLPPRLLAETSAATPFRHGFTAGALMVGVSMLIGNWAGATSLLEDWFDRIRFADGFAFRVTGLSEREQAAIVDLPFVHTHSAIGYLPLRVAAEQQLGVEGLAPPNVICIGFDAGPFFELNRIEWLQGDPAVAIPELRAGRGILVAEQFLTARGLGVGEEITLGGARTEETFEIVGVVSAAGLDIATQYFGVRSAYMEHALSCVFMDFDVVRDRFGAKEATIIQLGLDPSVEDDEVGAAIAEAVPGTMFASGRAIRATIDTIGQTMLAVGASTAFASLLLGCFGVGNVIAAGIYSRRFELGVLRAVGASPGLLVRLTIAEALQIAVAAFVTGCGLGWQLAVVGTGLYRDLLGLPLSVRFPYGPAFVGLLVVLLMATLSALPAAVALARRPVRELVAAGRG